MFMNKKSSTIKYISFHSLFVILITFFGSTSFGKAENFQTSKLDRILGKAEAPVTVVDYSSFTCSHCATFHSQVFPKLKEEYIDKGKIKLIFREVYFDGPGLWASMVARCTKEEAFFPTVDLIFNKQSSWTKGNTQNDIVEGLVSIGKQAGLSKSEILKCLKDRDKAKTLVEWYRGNALRDSVDSTPTILVNGNKISSNSFKNLKEKIDSYLNE